MREVDIDYLNKILRYDPETGDLYWRGLDHKPKYIQTRYANKKISGSVSNGYKRVKINGKHIFAHRIAFALYYGAFPSKYIDHINGDTLDNRIENLRECSLSNNQRNKRLNKNSTTKYTGVGFHKMSGRWRAYASDKGKQVHIGNHDDFYDAVKAREEYSMKNGFTNRHGARK